MTLGRGTDHFIFEDGGGGGGEGVDDYQKKSGTRKVDRKKFKYTKIPREKDIEQGEKNYCRRTDCGNLKIRE